MIIAKLTKRATGVTLWGDERDLRSLYETGSEVGVSNGEGIFDGQLEETAILSVLYDIRKAKEGLREREIDKSLLGFSDDKTPIYLGEKIVLPSFLFFIGFLKIAAKEGIPSFRQQADIATLVAAVFEAISEADFEVSQNVHKWLSHFSSLDSSQFNLEQYPPVMPIVAARHYISIPQKERLRSIVGVLAIATPGTPEFEEELLEVEEAADRLNIPIEELELEWPKFQW